MNARENPFGEKIMTLPLSCNPTPGASAIPLSFLLALLLVCALPAQAATGSEEDDWALEEGATDDVNEGELRFLEAGPDPAVLHSESRIRITPASLESGWVDLLQCYRNLDAVPKVEVVFDYREIRGLAVVAKRGVGSAEVSGQSVQLEDVSKQASLCIEAQVRNFYREADGSYVLRNGPYMRRFLDGYYPFRVSLEVNYPQELVRFLRISPQVQPGFEIESETGRVAFDAWFEGRLSTEIHFLPAA
jgi:hypothetical protein